MEDKTPNGNKREIMELLLKHGSSEVYLEDIYEKFKWDEIIKAFNEILSSKSDKKFHHIEDLMMEIFFILTLISFLN